MDFKKKCREYLSQLNDRCCLQLQYQEWGRVWHACISTSSITATSKKACVHSNICDYFPEKLNLLLKHSSPPSCRHHTRHTHHQAAESDPTSAEMELVQVQAFLRHGARAPFRDTHDAPELWSSLLKADLTRAPTLTLLDLDGKTSVSITSLRDSANHDGKRRNPLIPSVF
jgi:hypothetical protein